MKLDSEKLGISGNISQLEFVCHEVAEIEISNQNLNLYQSQVEIKANFKYIFMNFINFIWQSRLFK